MYLSVALCTHNGEEFLEKQLDSIINQSLKIDEIIICDDASTDKTTNILKFYQEKFPSLIKPIFNEAPLGTIKNFEKAITLTTGDLIFLSDQDDEWCYQKVQKTVSFFQNNKKCKLLFSNAFLIDEKNQKLNSHLWEKWGFHKEQRKRWKNNNLAFRDLVNNENKITGATVCFHKALKESSLPIEVPLGYWHDAWFGIHAAAVDSLCFIEDCLINYRVHPNQQIGLSTYIPKFVTQKGNAQSIDRSLFLSKIQEAYPEKSKNILTHKGNYTFFEMLKNYLIKIKRS